MGSIVIHTKKKKVTKSKFKRWINKQPIDADDFFYGLEKFNKDMYAGIE